MTSSDIRTRPPATGTTPATVPAPRPQRSVAWQKIRRNRQLYAMLVLPVAYLAIFNYWPMVGVQIAFRNYNPTGGIWGSQWVGLQNFRQFVNSYQFWPVIENTLILHFYGLIATFPLPIVLAMTLNYVRRRWLRRSVQMITYAPHFVSTVVVVGILFVMFDADTGIYPMLLDKIGVQLPNVITNPSWFRHVFVWSGAWQNMGFAAIIYLAALAGIDPGLHEAAVVDGASRVQRMWHIDLPGVLPVAVILLVLNMGSALTTGFEKVLLMQNPLNLDKSEVIDTYVYKIGLASQVPQFSYAAAIGVFQSAVGLVLIVVANRAARRLTSSGLW